MFAQQVVSGLSAGCLYAVAALGLVLIYRTMDIVNFAHGEMAMVSTFVAYTLLVRLKLPYPLAALGALAFAFVLGVVVERIFLRPIQNGPLISMMIMTLGLLMVLSGTAGWVWGHDPVSFPRAVSGRPFFVGDLIITRDSLLVLGLPCSWRSCFTWCSGLPWRAWPSGPPAITPAPPGSWACLCRRYTL